MNYSVTIFGFSDYPTEILSIYYPSRFDLILHTNPKLPACRTEKLGTKPLLKTIS